MPYYSLIDRKYSECDDNVTTLTKLASTNLESVQKEIKQTNQDWHLIVSVLIFQTETIHSFDVHAHQQTLEAIANEEKARKKRERQLKRRQKLSP